MSFSEKCTKAKSALKSAALRAGKRRDEIIAAAKKTLQRFSPNCKKGVTACGKPATKPSGIPDQVTIVMQALGVIISDAGGPLAGGLMQLEKIERTLVLEAPHIGVGTVNNLWASRVNLEENEPILIEPTWAEKNKAQANALLIALYRLKKQDGPISDKNSGAYRRLVERAYAAWPNGAPTR